MTEKLDLSCWTLFARVNAQSDTKIEFADNEGQKSPNIKTHVEIFMFTSNNLVRFYLASITKRQRTTVTKDDMMRNSLIFADFSAILFP